MPDRLPFWRLIGLIVFLVLGITGCAARTPGAETLTSPLAQTVAQSVLPSPVIAPTTLPAAATPSATPTAKPSPTPTVVLADIPLVILHTNDTWGETEPCG